MFNCYFNSFQYEGGFNSSKMCLLNFSNVKLLLVVMMMSLEILFLLAVFVNSFNFWVLSVISFLSLNIFFIRCYRLVFRHV